MLMVPRNNGLFDLSRSLMHLAEKIERQGPMDAEIVSSVSPQWYVVTTAPQHENIAAAHLVGRRFAVYQPQIKKTWYSKGKKRTRTLCLFPGYLFVFVWDLDRHRRRICACTGVSGILSTVTGMPVTVPWSEIDRIRAQENAENPLIISMDVVVRRRSRRKKRTKEFVETYVKETQVDPDEIVSITSKSYWKMPEKERFDQLHKALDLPPGTVLKA